jgi:adenine-specific DNA-methyltransferase
MNTRQERFIKLLETIFELDKSDLDFGIYRIMNIRRSQIIDFLKNGLPQKITETLKPFSVGSSDDLKAKIAAIEKQASEAGFPDVNTLPDGAKMKEEYIKLVEQLKNGSDMSALESDVYYALYSFFSRYYEEGDFISKRRYKEGVYSLPYEGEEVKLYWANHDQYYIKTSENFKDYTFKADDLTVHFRLVDATTEMNNNKETETNKRVFMLYDESVDASGLKTFQWDSESRELIIRFVYDLPKDKTKKYFDENIKSITSFLVSEHKDLVASLLKNVSLDAKKPQTLVEKHLKAYVAKNEFDYFIHKNLRGFLARELDFFIKNEVMHLDDLDTEKEALAETYLAKIKAVKKVGKIIIDFLAQIEDFQKKLWRRCRQSVL